MLLAECNQDCFNCIYDDCIISSNKVRNRNKKSGFDLNDPEQRKAYMKKYKAENKNRIKISNHVYYLENREEIIERNKNNYRKRRGDKNV